MVKHKQFLFIVKINDSPSIAAENSVMLKIRFRMLGSGLYFYTKSNLRRLLFYALNDQKQA